MNLITNYSKVKLATAVALVTTAAVILAGCTAQPKSTAPTPKSDTGTVKADEKKGFTTLTGTITKSGEEYLLTVPGKPTKGIDSYKLKLGDYVGKSVTVTGQYSGDTLFVNKID
jgi:hypothetical protein